MHNERCSDCKLTVERLLTAIYGRVEKNYRIEAGTSPDTYENTPLYPVLSDIYRILQGHRGHKDFVRSATLPDCDFWVPNPGFVVEFDESQHFTMPRAIALERYPNDLVVGFDRKHWIDLSVRLQKQDKDPPYRDEQRAWYDTLRDFLPAFATHLAPTVRLYAREATWCKLSETDLKGILRQKVNSGTTGLG